MKLLHVGDLHIGKRVYERLMLDEQRHAFDQLRDVAASEKVDAVLVAGDVFDKPTPIREALELSEVFFAGFLALGIPVLVIPGNHDSAQQVSYCSSITAAAGLHVAKAFSGPIEVIRLEDEFGPVDFHLLPFVRPTDVRMAFPERADEIKSHNDAVKVALEEHEVAQPFDPNARQVLLAHQFVVNGGELPATCESEIPSVGGIDAVQASNFDGFDYVALGHLHGRQSVRRPEVRYCGSPVKYSFSEARQTKFATIVELGASGGSEGGDASAHAPVTIKEIPLVPLREMREIEGSFDQIVEEAYAAALAEAGEQGDEKVAVGTNAQGREDYLRIRLTDRSVFDAFNRLRALFPNLLRLDWADSDLASASAYTESNLERVAASNPLELFEDFCLAQRGESVSDVEKDYLTGILADVETEAAR